MSVEYWVCRELRRDARLSSDELRLVAEGSLSVAKDGTLLEPVENCTSADEASRKALERARRTGGDHRVVAVVDLEKLPSRR